MTPRTQKLHDLIVGPLHITNHAFDRPTSLIRRRLTHANRAPIALGYRTQS